MNTFDNQATQVIDNLEAICIEVAGGLDNIIKLTIYLTDLEKFDSVNQIMTKDSLSLFLQEQL